MPQRKNRFTVREIVRQSLLTLYGVMIFSAFTGIIFDQNLTHIIQNVPVIVILVPAFINIAGDLSDVLGSRLSTLFYTGKLDNRFRPFSLYLTNLTAILAVSFTSFLAAGLVAYLVAILINHSSVDLFKLLVVVVGAGVLSTFIISIIASLLSSIIFTRGLDPDSKLPPITTTVGDLVGTSLLVYFTVLLLF